MKAIDRPFAKIINGATQFVVPVFQRNYSWSEENCQQLWNDILAAADDEFAGHFIGSVVYIATGDTAAGFTRWLLIDGQQRVTTLTLLLIALRDHLQNVGSSSSEDGPTVKRIEAYFLKNLQEEGAREAKLVLRRRDDETLKALLAGDELPADHSTLIKENYEFFRDQLGTVDPDVVYTGLNRLIVVDVTLERGIDDPQLIFESLNSTGVDLSQSDLIRNFVLMGQKEADQTRLYKDYWAKIEELFRGSERTFDNFIRDYLALLSQTKKLLKSDQVYFTFRQRFRSAQRNLEELEALLSDLHRMAKYYAAQSIGTPNDRIGRKAANLRGFGDVLSIVVMKLFDCYDRLGSLSENEFCEALDLLESYMLRRSLIGLQTRGYGMEFAKLAYSIDDETPFENFLVYLARMPETYAFPSDKEFRSALLETDVYYKRVCFHLLEGLENSGSKEPSPTKNYTIEHVLPQNPKLIAVWREALGENWEDEQQTWVHRLGNLTLTAYNSTYSDRSFEEKKSIKGGFSESSVRLNKDIRERSHWDVSAIEQRGVILAEKALQVWPGLSVDLELIERVELEEKKSLAGKRDPDDIQMSKASRALFSNLSARLRSRFPELVELPGSKSISYHDPRFFLEVIPRKSGLSLVIDLDYSESAAVSELMFDANDRTFIMYSEYSGGTVCRVENEGEIDEIFPALQLAHSIASSS
ncbi:DUF262 domain-containing protein [Ruegeria atlantica]|uniref:DUF262 domain-containing protein n=1 Tax=Ruegeria atlantica TaxID=81569 RepID=A0A0P1EAN2_9RHOB|nr:DUF262 domain-containing protein [Ruegeria atlantica]CUH46435.1 hypothetical protein RUA4292_00601 [Ruegeria atlantica]